MICQETQNVIHAYVDGELDLVKSLDVERHIEHCRDCATVHHDLVTLRSAIRQDVPYFRAPATLERTIRSELRPKSAAPRAWPRNWFAAAAAITLIAGGAWFTLHGIANNSEQLLAAEVTSAHVRSLMAEHLWDVKSTDRHTVKPWFDGKLDFAPDVRDFKNQSFPLQGGRLDYLNNRPVAALVYAHQKHSLNLFIWPAPGQPDRTPALTQVRGYALAHWTHAGMNYWAISDVTPETLQQFASLLQTSDPATTTTRPAD